MKKSTMGFITGVSVVTAGVIGLGAVSSWFTNWNTKTWFGRGGNNAVVQPENPDKPQPPTTNENTYNGGAIMSEFENNGISVLSAKLPRRAYAAYGISEQADTAYLLTATILPEEAFDKSVYWSVAWVDPESEWAADKTVTDYVTVTPTEDGALTANVVCLQAFGEQVKVIVTCRDNPTVKANSLCDYAKRISSLTVDMPCITNSPSFGINPSSTGINTFIVSADWRLNVTPNYSLGTIADTFTAKADFKLSDYGVTHYHANRVECVVGIGGIFSLYDVANKIFYLEDGKPGSAAFYNFLKDTPTNESQLTLTINYAGEQSDYTETFDFKILPELYKVKATSASVDNPSIIF